MARDASSPWYPYFVTLALEGWTKCLTLLLIELFERSLLRFARNDGGPSSGRLDLIGERQAGDRNPNRVPYRNRGPASMPSNTRPPIGYHSGAIVTVWAIAAAVTVMRAIADFKLPLTGDEAYYWEWSRHLAFGPEFSV